MIRILSAVGAAVLGLPLLLVAAITPTAPSPSLVASPGGSDDAQVAVAPPDLREHFLAAARSYAVPPALLVAVAEVASGYEVDAAGPAGAGLMQLSDAQMSDYSPVRGASPRDSGPAVQAAARMLLDLGALRGGAWDAVTALAGYPAVAGDADVVLDLAAQYGYRYSPDGPPLDPDRYAFPVVGPASYGAAHHDYPATDIFAAIGTPLVACVRAEVLRMSLTEVGLGGITVTLRGEDGWRYYYAHLDSVADDLVVGQIVEPGQLLGRSGNTGNARTTPPHLHLGISKTGSAAGQISPYSYLQLWEGK